LVLAADDLELATDGGVTAVARNKFEGHEAAFNISIQGGMQPSRLAGAVNPLAHVMADAVVLSSRGEATERFVQAVAVALDQEIPELRKKKRGAGAVAHEVRFAALLVTREGDALYPRTLHLKLFCKGGGELYLDLDCVQKRVTLAEKDLEFRPAVWRALAALGGPTA
jgi:hypothetical protein